jgi:hypothetical protein
MAYDLVLIAVSIACVIVFVPCVIRSRRQAKIEKSSKLAKALARMLQ